MDTSSIYKVLNDKNNLRDSRINNDSYQSYQQRFKYDSGYLDKFLFEIEFALKQSQEYQILSQSFKKAVSRFAKDCEGNLLKDLKQPQLESVYRDISRIFDKEDEGIVLKDKIRQLMNLRLEDVRRQIKDNKWNIITNLIQNLILKNRGNRDCFDLLAYRQLPIDLRQIIWKFCLDNQEESKIYSEKIRENRLLTISKFDLQIIKDMEEFVQQMCDIESFDGSMIFCAKTILSYYEVRKDRILSDYLYLLVIPLMTVYAEAKHMHKIPVDLVGYFFTIQKIVAFFDPLVDLLVIQDENYEQEMTDYTMNSLALVDEEVLDKIQEVLNLDIPSQRTMIVLIVKRFVHSLGFAFLSMDITLYLQDQIIMKIIKNKLEIFIDFAIMLKCLKELILQENDWDKIVDIIYQKGKQIPFQIYYNFHRQIMKNSRFYQSQYNVDPQIVNRGNQIFDNPLQRLIDNQIQRDKKAYKKKWIEDENENNYQSSFKQQKKAFGNEDGSDEIMEEDDEEEGLRGKKVQLQKINTEEIMKKLKTKQQIPENMGMVPMLNDQGSEEENVNNYNIQVGNGSGSEDVENDEFDILQGMN